MIRLTPIDAAINGQSDIYMRLANINMTSELFRTFLSDCIRKLAAYEDLGTVEELAELVAAKQDNRLVELPCKVGDTVYEPRPDRGKLISVYNVISIHVSRCSMLIGWELLKGIYSNLNGFEASALGKTVFLTREEAEAALKEQTNGTP